MFGTIRRRARTVLMACISAVVVLGTVGFVASPATPALAFDQVVVSPAAQGTEVVYGKVTQPNGRGFSGARVTVFYVNSSGQHVIEATALTATNGTYRTTFRDRCRNYKVTIAAVVGGALTRATLSVEMCPGNAYRVSAHLTSRGHFAFFPVSSY
jgi:hypothetical protein